MNLEPGTIYEGVVASAWVEEAYKDPDTLVIRVKVRVGDDELMCKHTLGGKQLDRSIDVAKHLNAWPNLDHLESNAEGKAVSVWCGEYEGRYFGKINTPKDDAGGGKKADPDKIKAAVARLTGDDDDNTPF